MADADIQQAIMEALADPMNLPSEFWNYSTQRWLADAPVFPISQVFGFTQFTADAAPLIATAESTTATAYGDLTTVGPQLSNLPDGHFVVFFGSVANVSGGGASAIQSVKANAVEAVDGDAVYTGSTNGTGIARATLMTLSNNGSNTLTVRYKNNVAGQTAFFAARWLIAIKYGNL